MMMGDLGEFALMALSTLFVIVDPVGAVPAFLVMTQGDDPRSRSRTARTAALTAFSVLSFFALIGRHLFRLLGLSPAALSIAGGIVLFGISLNMLKVQPSRVLRTPEEVEEGVRKEEVGVIPLGMPMLGGPGAITAVVALMSRVQTPFHLAVLLAAIAIVCMGAYLILRGATLVERALGETGMRVATRLMGLLLAALSVQFVLNGISQYMSKIVLERDI